MNKRSSLSKKRVLTGMLICFLLVSSSLLIATIRPVAAATPPSLDGTVAIGCGHNTNSCSASLSTSHSNDIIMVYTTESLDLLTSCTFSVSDTARLAWTLRASAAGRNDGSTGGYRDQLGEFWAVSANPLSSDAIMETISGCAGSYGGEYNGFEAFGVNGANLNSPFDPNVSLPASTNGYSNTPAVTISTSNPNDMIISIAQQSSYGTLTPGSGFTSLIPGVAASEYQTTSSTVSSLSVNFGDSATWYWEMIADAITGQATPPDFAFQALPPSVQTSYSSANAASVVIPVTVISQGGFSGTVNLSVQANCTGAPACSLTPTTTSVNLVNSGSSTAQFTFSTTVGPYDRNDQYITQFYDLFTVTGTSGSLTHQASTEPILCLPPNDLKNNNWSGYVMDFNCNPYNSPVYFASAGWYVPSVSEPKSWSCFNQDCSIVPWVGLMHDPLGANGIVQIGTISNVHCLFGCSTHYSAVWEFFPAPYQDCGITVNAGDAMFASITDNVLSGGSSTQYTLEIDNHTNGQTCKQVHSFSDITNPKTGQPLSDMGTPNYAGFIVESPGGQHLPSFSNFYVYNVLMRDPNNSPLGFVAYNYGWWLRAVLSSDSGPNIAIGPINRNGPTTNSAGVFLVTYLNSNGRQ